MNGNYGLMAQHGFYSLMFALLIAFVFFIINLLKKDKKDAD